MMRNASLLLFSLPVVSAVTFEDTPLTTKLWQLISKTEASSDPDGALETFLYEHPSVAPARSADQRGGAWWAWEFKNEFALGALEAYGSDVNGADEDEGGMTAKAMCPDSTEDCEKMLEEAKKIKDDVLKRKGERDDRKAKEEEDDDEDMDDDEAKEDDTATIPKEKLGKDKDYTVGSDAGMAKKKKEKASDSDLDIAVDDDDDGDEEEL